MCHGMNPSGGQTGASALVPPSRFPRSFRLSPLRITAAAASLPLATALLPKRRNRLLNVVPRTASTLSAFVALVRPARSLQRCAKSWRVGRCSGNHVQFRLHSQPGRVVSASRSAKPRPARIPPTSPRRKASYGMLSLLANTGRQSALEAFTRKRFRPTTHRVLPRQTRGAIV